MATDYVVRLQGQDNLSGTIKGAKKSLEDFGKETTKLESLEQKFKKIENSTAPLKRKLKDLQSMMAQMNLDGLSNTDLFSQLAQQAGTYKDAICDASTATNQFANDNFKLQAGIQALQGMAAAASIATGAMGLLGTENEKVQQAILKVQSALAILNGVQSVANMLNKDSALMHRIKQIRQAASIATTKADTIATTANTIATGTNTAATAASTAAQNAWNVAKAVAKALLGDWTGLVLVGAVALGTYAIATSESTDKLKQQEEALKKADEAQKNYTEDVASGAGKLVGKYQMLSREWKRLKTDAEKSQWIRDNATDFQNLGLKVDDLRSAEDQFVNNTQNVVKALEARAKAMAAQSMMVDAYTQYYKTIMEADSSVSGGGLYTVYKGRGKGWTANNPNITDEMKAAGVTISDFNQRTTQKRSGGLIYDTTEYQESQTVIDKVNHYRIEQARTTNRQIKEDAEATLNKTLTFANQKITEANKVIEANGLDFTQHKTDTTTSTKTKTKTTKAERETTFEVGSLADYEAQLQKITTTIKNTDWTGNDELLNQLVTERDELETQIELLKERLGLIKKKPETTTPEKPKPKTGSIGDYENQIREIKTKMDLEVVGTDQWNELRRQLAELTDKEFAIRLQIQGCDIKSESEKLEEFKAQMDSVSNITDSLGNAFNSLGNAVGGTTGTFLSMTSTVLQGVSQIIPQVVALISAKQAEAIASGTASGAALPFPANLAAIASIIATITSVFASIAGSFADGGVISGSSYHGDKLLARVNAGEMILNSTQQAKLFNMINTGGNSGGTASVNFKISGSNLVGVLKNYNSKIGKIQ